MKVLYVASEALPFMASGGLGDVAGLIACGSSQKTYRLSCCNAAL